MCHTLETAAEGRGKRFHLQDAKQDYLGWPHKPKHTAFVDRYPLNALSVLRVIGHPLSLHMAVQAKSKNLSCRNFVFLLKSVLKCVSFPNDSGRFPRWPNNTLFNYWSSSKEGLTKENGFIKELYWQLLCLKYSRRQVWKQQLSMCNIWISCSLHISNNSCVRTNLMEP